MLEARLPFDNCSSTDLQNNIKSLNWGRPITSSSEAVEVYNCIFTK
jgi:hypothetical protein